jgi:hypothetical protein
MNKIIKATQLGTHFAADGWTIDQVGQWLVDSGFDPSGTFASQSRLTKEKEMKQTVTFGTFASAFSALRPDNFTYQGLQVLFDYLTDHEMGSGQEIEFDVIALCRDFAEGDAQDIANDYGLELPDNEDDADDLVYHFLRNEGALIDITQIDTFVYRTF